MRNLKIALSTLILGSVILGCVEFIDESATVSDNQSTVELTGTVAALLPAEGSFVIIGDDGEVYEPNYLEESYRVDCLRVRVVLRFEPDVVSINTLGTAVDVLTIEAIGSCDVTDATFGFVSEENQSGMNDQEFTDRFVRE